MKPFTKSVGLRKSRYDPKAIARDILITTSRDPFQWGLNAHLTQLEHYFSKVNDSADLSTLCWDLLDPRDAPVGSANMSSPATEPLIQSSIGRQTSSARKQNARKTILPVARETLRPTRGGSSLRGTRGSDHRSNQPSVPAQPSGLRYSSTAGLISDIAVVIKSTSPPVNGKLISPRNSRSRH